MTTTWTDIVSTDVDTDSPLDEDLFQALRDNANAVRQTIFGISVSETSTTSTSFVTLHSFRINVPGLDDYTTIQRQINGEAQAKIAKAAATGTLRLEDDSTGTTGSETTFNATTYGYESLTLDVAAAWKGTTRTINIQAKTDNASYATSIKYDQGVGWRLDY